MQDWDFPHFTNTLDVNLPGFHKHIINIDTVEIQISGKWFNYGIIFLVMIFDLNMWKNQIFYYPEKYGQYIGEFSDISCMFDSNLNYKGSNLLYLRNLQEQVKKAFC